MTQPRWAACRFKARPAGGWRRAAAGARHGCCAGAGPAGDFV